MIAAENVKRQKAVRLVIPVKEAAELIAVNRIVGGIEVENDLVGRRIVSLKKQCDKELFDRLLIQFDLAVAALRRCSDERGFNAMQRAFPGQWLASIRLTSSILPRGIGLADDRRKQLIRSQFIMVIQIFVPLDQPDNSLTDQLRYGMVNQLRIAIIGEAFSELFQNSGLGFDRLDKKGSGITGDLMSVKSRYNFTPAECSKSELV